MNEPDDVPAPAGLDPDAAIRGHAARVGAEVPVEPVSRTGEGFDERIRRPPTPVIETRKYQRMIGLFGLVLVIAFSIYLYARGGNGTPGIASGRHLHDFVAPLATADLGNVSANPHPVCDPARPARRGLNVCGRRPTVLAFFAPGAKPCIEQVDTLAAVAPQFPRVQFAAVAVDAGHAATAKLVRQHRWRIPVAYDSSGAIGQLYGVEVCPLVEIANAHGVVVRRLIGEAWLAKRSLAGAVATLGG